MRSLNPMTLLLTLLLSISLVGCGSSKKKAGAGNESSSSTQDTDMGAENRSLEINGDSDAGKAGPLSTVYFAFNSASLSSKSRSVLKANADFLKGSDSVEIQVEGHCDERGGVQYNLALGEKRAQAVKQYLVSMGVSSARVSTISFGKERPISFGHDELAWNKNRRANFVVTAK